MNPVQVDVIAPLPEGWGICMSCEALMADANLDQAPHQRGLDEYPVEWLADFYRLSDLIIDLAGRYPDQISIRIWDPRSLQGLVKSLRFGVHRYPAFIIANHQKVSGWDTEGVEKYILEAVNGAQA